MSQPRVSEPAFWEGLYARQGDRWELGGPTPPLVEYLAREPRPPGTAVAVPGCGRGHDAHLLARRGYRVWGFDFAEPAIREARPRAAQAGLDVVFEQRDIFGLAEDYRGFFDGIWEYTCKGATATGRLWIPGISRRPAPNATAVATGSSVRRSRMATAPGSCIGNQLP